MKPTYQQAKEAKEILIKYLKERLCNYDISDITENRDVQKESLVLFALLQEYFLD